MRSTVISTKMLIITLFIIIAVARVSATIINVPDDYSTIQAGINASSAGDTVLVQPGTYVENIDFNGHNITLGSLFLITDDTSYISSTIIDGNAADRVVKFDNGENSSAIITGFTIQNGRTPYTGAGIFCYNFSSPTINNNIITGNITTSNHGGGIYCTDYSNATIINNTITENQAQLMGGGISCYTASPIITNNTISGNTAVEWDGGGIDCYDGANPVITYNIITGNSARYGGGIDCSENSHATIINNTISGNTASIGGGILCWDSDPNITNTVFWEDSAPNGPEIFIYGSANPIITYCDVEGGWTGTGNIDADPLFVDPDNGDFHLQLGSPCIDTGDPDSPFDPDGTRADMGAFYFNQSTGIDEEILTPTEFTLCQNYPNPFNSSTTISYNLSYSSKVIIDIYDILGRKVETLVSKEQPAGYHQAVWKADGFSSGVYFYKLTAGEHEHSKKMILIK